MNKSLKLLAGVLAATMLLVTACGAKSKPAEGTSGPSQTQTVKKGANGEVYGGTYHVAIGEEPPTLDVQKDTTLQVYTMARDLFSTLIRYKGNTLNLEPELLKEMPKAEGDKTYHFTLRDDVTFTNGVKLTAKDVKYTFERMLLPATKSQNTWVLEEIDGAKDMIDGKATELKGVKVTGDFTFDITLGRPFGPFLANLATPPASIYPADYAKEQGDKFGRNPIGTGPFKMTEWKPNQSLVLEKNATYFEKGLPYLDKLEYKVIPEESTRWLEFEQGNYDDSDIPTAQWDNATKSGKWTVLSVNELNTYYLSLSNTVIKDKRVRQAISLGIDRKKIIDTLLHGQATVATSFVTPEIPGALKGGAGFPFDPAKAKALLAEAGATKLTIEAMQRGGDKASDVNLAIQQMMKDIGIDWKVTILDKAAFKAARAAGTIVANYGNWYADYPDPDNYLYTYFETKSSKSMSVNYASPDADKILVDARGLADQAKRQTMYQDLEKKLIYDEYAMLPLWHATSTSVTQKSVHGVPASPTGVGGAKTVWKDAGSK